MNLPLADLESKIGYKFKNKGLLETALTHSSYANEHDVLEIHSNERLEFLGDAALSMEVALLIFEKGEHLSEGDMTRVRAALVRSERLADIARGLGLGRFLRLGVGAEKTDVRENDSALEDAFEALVAAVFLDGGNEAAHGLVARFFSGAVEECIRNDPRDGANYDYKSRLQMVLQTGGAADIHYVVKSESGPDHDKRFLVEVVSEGDILGTGEGKTKKTAEQRAAKMALEGRKCI